MKKVLSILMVVAMLAGIVTLVPNAAVVSPAKNGNVSIEAHYFDGTLSYCENGGTKGDQISVDDEYVIKEGNENKIRIDGVLDEGEWGDPIATISSEDAANNISVTGAFLSDVTNALFEKPSAENTYYYATQYSSLKPMKYTVYILWDEDYLYLAAEVFDPDGYKQVNGEASLWDGDCLQFRVDTQGVNASAEDGAYDASATTTYTDKDGNKTIIHPQPWYGTVRSETGNVKYDTVNNIMFSYNKVQGYTEVYDAALSYDREEQQFEYLDENGDIQVGTRVLYHGTDCTEYGDNWAETPAYAAVHYENYGTLKERDDHTYYEIAMPWAILQNRAEDATEFIATAGAEVGFSLALLDASVVKAPNGESARDGFCSWLSWGSGICGSQTLYDPQTTGGNNALVLSDVTYKEYEGCEHTFAEASCVAPETCTKCGYMKGYESGHEYTFSDVTLPTSTKDGSIKATCTVCDDTYTATIDGGTSKLVDSFTTSDTSIVSKGNFGTGWNTSWYDDTSSNESRKMLYNEDGTNKTGVDTKIFGYSILDLASRGEGLYYANMTPATISDDVKIDTQMGTYFEYDVAGSSAIKAENGFSYQTEIYITDWADQVATGYLNGYYTWFGGPTNYKYQAGLFCTDRANGKFAFVIGESGVIASEGAVADLEKNAIAYKEIDASKVAAGEWHTFTTIFDNDSDTMLVFWDGELQVAANDYHFDTPDIKYIINRRMGVPMYLKNVMVATPAYAAENYKLSTGAGSATTYTATINGVANEYAAGETVNYSAPAFDSANAARLTGWEGDTDVLTDATAASGTFTMPEKAVTLTPKYTKVGDTNGDGKINAQDANYIAQIIVGSAPSVSPADINADGKVNATDANLMKKIITGTYAPVA